MAFWATNQNGDATTLKLAALLEGGGKRSRTNQKTPVRVTPPELLQAALGFANSPYDFHRPAVTLKMVRPLRQRRGGFVRLAEPLAKDFAAQSPHEPTPPRWLRGQQE